MAFSKLVRAQSGSDLTISWRNSGSTRRFRFAVAHRRRPDVFVAHTTSTTVGELGSMTTRTWRSGGAQKRAQVVMNSLHLGCPWRANTPLKQLREPISLHPCSGGDLPLTQARFVDKLVCTLQQVHRPSLAKDSPSCKENLPQVNCHNGSQCEGTHKITLRRGWLRLAVRLAL